MTDSTPNFDSALPHEWASFLEDRLGDAATDGPRSATERARGLAGLLPTSAGEWWMRARASIARAVRDESLECGAALRGARIRSMHYEQAGARIDLEVEPLRLSAKPRGILRGQVESDASCMGSPVAIIGATGGIATTTTLDDVGFFSATLPPGVYDVAIGLPAGAVCVAEVFIE